MMGFAKNPYIKVHRMFSIIQRCQSTTIDALSCTTVPFKVVGIAHQPDSAKDAADSMNTKCIRIHALDGLLVETQVVFDVHKPVADRGAGKAHDEGSSVINIAGSRRDDYQASDSSRYNSCGDKRSAVEKHKFGSIDARITYQ